MKVCILCDNENIEEARKRIIETSVFSNELKEVSANLSFRNEEVLKHLAIPLSENGEFPATHWFCFMKADEKTYERMLDSQKYTIIEESTPSVFLEKYNLKRIKKLK